MNIVKIGASAWTTAQQNEYDQRLNEWATAFVCYRLTRARQLSRRVAELGISEDTGNKLTAAWLVFLQIREYDARKARELRRRYNYRRFVEMGGWWTRYEFPHHVAVEHLESDKSNAEMVAEIRNTHDQSPAWERTLIGLYKPFNFLSSTVSLPHDVKEWVEQGKKILVRYQKGF